MKKQLYIMVIGMIIFGCVARKERISTGLRTDAYAFASRQASDLKRIDSRWEWREGEACVRELTFSAPDDSGKQYVEKAVWREQHWRQTDSSQVRTEQEVTDSLAFRHQEVVKTEGRSLTDNRMGGWRWCLLAVALISVALYLFRRN